MTSHSTSAKYKVDQKKYAENYQRIFGKNNQDTPQEETEEEPDNE